MIIFVNQLAPGCELMIQCFHLLESVGASSPFSVSRVRKFHITSHKTLVILDICNMKIVLLVAAL